MDPIFSRFPLLYCCFNEQDAFRFNDSFPVVEKKDIYIFLGPVCQALVDFIQTQIPDFEQKKIFWFSSSGEVDIGLKNPSFFNHEQLVLWDLVDPSTLAYVVAERIQELDFQVFNFFDHIDDAWLEHFNKAIPMLFYTFSEKVGKHNVLKNIFSNSQTPKTFIDYIKKENAFLNKPLLIVGAGPSYDVYKHQIQRLQKSCYIMGIGTGLRFLDQDLIDADFGVVVDPNPETFKRLASIKDPKILFSSLRTQRDFYKKNGSLIALLPILSMMGLNGLKNVFPECPVLSKMPMEGCTTASIALQIAIFLGFSPIIMVGCDLEYKDKGYAGDIESRWPQERFKPEIAALKSQAKSPGKDFYRVIPGCLIEGFKTIDGDLFSVLDKTFKKEEVSVFFDQTDIDCLEYIQRLKTSLCVCQHHWDHPLKEILLEEELAYSDVLKDFEMEPVELHNAMEL